MIEIWTLNLVIENKSPPSSSKCFIDCPLSYTFSIRKRNVILVIFFKYLLNLICTFLDKAFVNYLLEIQSRIYLSYLFFNPHIKGRITGFWLGGLLREHEYLYICGLPRSSATCYLSTLVFKLSDTS